MCLCRKGRVGKVFELMYLSGWLTEDTMLLLGEVWSGIVKLYVRFESDFADTEDVRNISRYGLEEGRYECQVG